MVRKDKDRCSIIKCQVPAFIWSRDDVTYKEAINIARQTIESGKAKEKLEQFIEMSNSFK